MLSTNALNVINQVIVKSFTTKAGQKGNLFPMYLKSYESGKLNADVSLTGFCI